MSRVFPRASLFLLGRPDGLVWCSAGAAALPGPNYGRPTGLFDGGVGSKAFVIVLREPPTVVVAFVWDAKAVFFGGQDLGPSIIEQVLARLKLQLLLP